MHWSNSNCPGRPVGEGFGWWLVTHDRKLWNSMPLISHDKWPTATFIQANRELFARTKSATARTSSEHATSILCNHVSFIRSRLAYTMCTNYPGSKLVWAVCRFEEKNWKLVKCSRRRGNCKTGHFTSLIGRKRPWNERKLHVRSVQK